MDQKSSDHILVCDRGSLRETFPQLDLDAGQAAADCTWEHKGTLMPDATCAPQQIAFPQDINLLNEARENLETIIDTICYEYNEPKPRTYRWSARGDYLALAKKKKRTRKTIREALRKQLQYVRRDLKYIDRFVVDGKEICPAHAAWSYVKI